MNLLFFLTNNDCDPIYYLKLMANGALVALAIVAVAAGLIAVSVHKIDEGKLKAL